MKQRIPSDYKNDVSKYNHNIRSGEFGTIHSGVLIPVKSRHLNIGDRVRGDIETLVQSEPFQGPVMQGFDIYTVATFTPDSVIYGWQDNGRNFTPEELLSFDNWTYGALSPKTPSITDSVATSLRPLGFYNFNSRQFASDIVQNWPFGLCGRTANDIDDVNEKFLTSVGKGGLWDWIGVPAGATPQALTRSAGGPQLVQKSFIWNVAPVVAYALTANYYFRNMQEELMWFTRGVHNLANDESQGMLDVLAFYHPNEMLQSVEYMHYYSRSGNVDNIQLDNNGIVQGTAQHTAPIYGWQKLGSDAETLNRLCTAGLAPYGGLICAPYKPDLFNNLIQLGSTPEAHCEVTAFDGPDGASTGIAIADLRAANKQQLMLDRLFASGGTWDGVRKALFGTKGNTTSNKPQFLGVWRSAINPINQVSQSAGQGSEGIVDLGQMAARLDSWSNYGNQEYIDYFAEESGTLLFVSVIMPKPAYSQGLNPDLAVHSWADDFNPELNGEGFVTVPRSRYSLLPVSESYLTGTVDNGLQVNDVAVGEEVAWSWLRTDFDRLHGEFSSVGDRQYWTIHRDFTNFDLSDADREPVFYGETITSYINPMDVQYLFTLQDFASPNFRLMANVNLSVTNAVADHYMPFLGR